MVSKKILITFVFLFFISFVSANFGYNQRDLPLNITTSTITINTNISNSTDWWDDLDTINSTQMEQSNNELNIKVTWIQSIIGAISKWLIDVPGGYLYNDTTKVYFNETKLNESIDLRVGVGGNLSWNESYAITKFAPNTTRAIQLLLNGTGVYTLGENASWNESYAITKFIPDGNASSICNIGEYLDGSSACHNFNDSVKRLFTEEQVVYNASTINTTTGTLDSGNLSDVQILGDGLTYNVSEVTGAPGFLITINFTDVVGFNVVALRGRYEGGAGHTLALELFRIGTQTWEERSEITDQMDFGVTTFDVFIGSNFIDDLGTVQFRINHDDNGITNHDYFLDAVFIGQVTGIVSGGDLADLTGRDEACVLLPDVFCKDGSKNITGDVNWDGFNLTNIREIRATNWSNATFQTDKLYALNTTRGIQLLLNNTNINFLNINSTNITVKNIHSPNGKNIIFWNDLNLKASSFLPLGDGETEIGSKIFEFKGIFIKNITASEQIFVSNWSNLTFQTDKLYAPNTTRGIQSLINNTVGWTLNFTRVNTNKIFSLDEQTNITYSDLAEGYLVVDGDGDYVNASSPTMDLVEGTLTAWVNLASGSGDDGETRQVVSIGNPADGTNRVEIKKSNTNKLSSGYRANNNNDNPVAVVVASDFEGKWGFMVAIWNLSHVSFYVDGAFKTSVAKDNDFTADTFVRIKIGSISTSDAQFFNGFVDEVMYFNDDLTPAEIIILNDSGRHNQTYTHPDLVSWYKLNSDVTDSVGGKDGELFDNAFIFKSVVKGYNTQDFKIEDLIGDNIFGTGIIMMSGIGESSVGGDFGIGGDVIIKGQDIIFTEDTNTITLIAREPDISIDVRGNDGGIFKTAITFAFSEADIDLESDFNVIAESGIRIGSDTLTKEIYSSSQGSGSSPLYIGNREIDVSVPSDGRLKDIIGLSSTTLDDLMGLSIYEYTYNENYNASGIFTGLIAQDVQNIFPELIRNFTISIREPEPIIERVCEFTGTEFEYCRDEIVNMTEEEIEDYLMIEYKGFIPKILKWTQDLFNWNTEQDERTDYLEEEICKKDNSYGFCRGVTP